MFFLDYCFHLVDRVLLEHGVLILPKDFKQALEPALPAHEAMLPAIAAEQADDQEGMHILKEHQLPSAGLQG